jgi:hypothetical protein
MFAVAAIKRGRERLIEYQMVKLYQKLSETKASAQCVTENSARDEE